MLGERERDVVAHAAELQGGFEDLREYVGEVAERLEARLGDVELGLRGAISHRALVRYDAYNELSGHQSVSIALLDGTRSGVVLTCIHHRDQARVYLKQVHEGEGELELSPEEAEAVRLALSPAGSGVSSSSGEPSASLTAGAEPAALASATWDRRGPSPRRRCAAARRRTRSSRWRWRASTRRCWRCEAARCGGRWCRSRTRSMGR